MALPYSREELSVHDLLLDLKNPRFPEQPDQPSAIGTMLNREWESIYDLAHHITTHKRLNPLDSTLVVPDGSGKKQFIVIEGNRRATALKSLHNPELLDLSSIGEGKKKKFRELSAAFLKHPIGEIECVVYEDQNHPDVLEWRALKHSGSGSGKGAAQKDWDGMAKERDRANRNRPTAQYSLMQKVATNTNATEELKSAFLEDRIPPSTIKKAIDSPTIRKALGLEKKGERIWHVVPEDEFYRRVSSFLTDFIQPKDKPNDARMTEEKISVAAKQRTYAAELDKRLGNLKEEEQIAPEEVKVVESEKEPEKEDDSANENNQTNKKGKTSTRDRKLIPQDFHPRNLPPKARRLIEELRDKLPVHKSPIAVAFGTRALIEYTLYETARALGVPLEPDGLKDLGLRVAAHMQNENDAARAHNKQPSLKKADRKDDPYNKNAVAHLRDLCGQDFDTNPNSIQRLHQYVHNPFMIPDEDGLHKLWDAYQLTLEYLWQLTEQSGITKDDGTTSV